MIWLIYWNNAYDVEIIRKSFRAMACASSVPLLALIYKNTVQRFVKPRYFGDLSVLLRDMRDDMTVLIPVKRFQKNASAVHKTVAEIFRR